MPKPPRAGSCLAVLCGANVHHPVRSNYRGQNPVQRQWDRGMAMDRCHHRLCLIFGWPLSHFRRVAVSRM